MIKNESVKKILTTDVISVHTKQKLSDVNKIFRENFIHHIPVLNGNKPIGIISSNDIFKLVFNIDTQDERMLDTILDNQFSIESVMTTDLVTLPVSSSVKDAASALESSKIHSVLITNNDELVGIVTSTDLIKYLHNNIR